MLTPASIIVLANAVNAMADIKTVIVAREASGSGRESWVAEGGMGFSLPGVDFFLPADLGVDFSADSLVFCLSFLI
jgi:hypothetical protein